MRLFLAFALVFSLLAQAAYLSLQPQEQAACVGEQVFFEGALSNTKTTTEQFALSLAPNAYLSGYVTTPVQVPAGETRSFLVAASPACHARGTQEIEILAESAQGEKSRAKAWVSVESCVDVEADASSVSQAACVGQTASYSILVTNPTRNEIHVRVQAEGNVSNASFYLDGGRSRRLQMAVLAEQVGEEQVPVLITASRGCDEVQKTVTLQLSARTCAATTAPYYYVPSPTPYYPTAPATPTPSPTTPAPTPIPTSSPTPTSTPGPTFASCLYDWQCVSGRCNAALASCEPEATITPAGTPSPTPTTSPVANATPVPTSEISPTPSTQLTETGNATATPSATQVPVSDYDFEAEAPEQVEFCENGSGTVSWKLRNNGLDDVYKLAVIGEEVEVALEKEAMALKQGEETAVSVTVKGKGTAGIFELKLFAESQSTGTAQRSLVKASVLAKEAEACKEKRAERKLDALELERAQFKEGKAKLTLKNKLGESVRLQVHASEGWTLKETEIELEAGGRKELELEGSGELKLSFVDAEGVVQQIELKEEGEAPNTGLFVASLSKNAPYVLGFIAFILIVYLLLKQSQGPPEKPEKEDDARFPVSGKHLEEKEEKNAAVVPSEHGEEIEKKNREENSQEPIKEEKKVKEGKKAPEESSLEPEKGGEEKRLAQEARTEKWKTGDGKGHLEEKGEVTG